MSFKRMFCRTLILLFIFVIPFETKAACSAQYSASIAACDQVNGTVHIPGGATPYVISTPNKEYILDGDLSVDGSAITINASNVVLNLNGHTITYNNFTAGCGVLSGGYNFSNVAVANGSILQGAAMSDGTTYGIASNPIRFHSGSPASYNVSNVQIIDINARYGSRDTGGFQLGGNGHLVENNSLEDTYEYGIITDRHSGIASIKMWGSDSIVRNNAIINARQRGIDAGNNDEIYGNIIGIRSVATNSIGIYTEVGGAKIHDNNIIGRGEHPIGIAAHSSTVGVSLDNEIYRNNIDVKTTRAGLEYNGSYPADPVDSVTEVDFAVGIRSTSGTQNLSVHDNTINVYSDSDFLGNWSPDGRQLRISAGARGIMAGLRYNSQSAKYYNNIINASDKDGTGYAVGIACDANIDNANWYDFKPPASDFGPGLIFRENSITSNIFNITVGDKYGPCSGSPLFIKNTLIKSENFNNYATYASGFNGYYEGTGRFISNNYQAGAAENSLKMYFESISNNIPNVSGSYRNKEIIFGWLQQDGYIFYDYKLHNNGGETGTASPIHVDLNQLGPFFELDGIPPHAPGALNVE